jgi:hypothetical protein
MIFLRLRLGVKKYLLVYDPSGNIKLEAIDDYRIRKTIRREKTKMVGVA